MNIEILSLERFLITCELSLDFKNIQLKGSDLRLYDLP